MGKIITNRQVIDVPPLQPLRYGVFTAAAAMPTMPREIIASGLQFVSDHCGEAQLYDQTCVDNPVKTFDEGAEIMGADPYWIVARKRCGTVGRTAEMALRAARTQLGTSAQTLVESAIWDGGGLASIDPTLTSSGATTVTPLAPGAGAAIAALEEAFYDVYGYVGTIHINMQAYAALQYAGLLNRSGGAGVLRTPIGTAVSIGAGYGITGPGDVAPTDPTSVWAFITPPITIWRSGVLPQPPATQTLDRSLNQWDTVAEEVFAHAWDCPETFAVEVPVAAPGVVAVA
jgi:hypothetical protein